MYQVPLPNLRGTVDGAPARCSKCRHTSFSTSLGVGELYWNGGNGGRVVLDNPDDGARVLTSVKCVRCKLEHAPVIEFPEPASKNMGSDTQGRGRPD